MPPGLTVNDATGRGPVGTGVTGTVVVTDALFTVTVTDFVMAPAALTAVNVYVVVLAGVTVELPAADIEPMPWSMIRAVAFETLQMSSEEPPSDIESGLAVNELIVGTPANGKPAHDASKSGSAIERERSKRDNLPFIILTFPPELLSSLIKL